MKGPRALFAGSLPTSRLWCSNNPFFWGYGISSVVTIINPPSHKILRYVHSTPAALNPKEIHDLIYLSVPYTILMFITTLFIYSLLKNKKPFHIISL